MRQNEELEMYECDKQGYTIINTADHHPNDLYEGNYAFDSPGLYYQFKTFRDNLYKMEITYDSEDLSINFSISLMIN